MLRIRSIARACVLVTTLALPATMFAQPQGYKPPPRFEITPFGAYNWGGSFDTQALATISAGEINEEDAFSWGVILGFLAQRNSAVEIWYLRQDTDVNFNPNVGQKRGPFGFANNYIQFGFRQDLNVSSEGRVKPFVTGSLGMNVLDPEAGDVGTSTRFAWTLGGGAKFSSATGRVGFRLDLRWMVTPVPSGTYGTWCDVWGCYAVSGTDWLHQGSVGGGIVLAF